MLTFGFRLNMRLVVETGYEVDGKGGYEAGC